MSIQFHPETLGDKPWIGASEMHRITCDMVGKGIRRLEDKWGRKPTFKNIHTLTEQEVESLKSKPSQDKLTA